VLRLILHRNCGAFPLLTSKADVNVNVTWRHNSVDERSRKRRLRFAQLSKREDTRDFPHQAVETRKITEKRTSVTVEIRRQYGKTVPIGGLKRAAVNLAERFCRFVAQQLKCGKRIIKLFALFFQLNHLTVSKCDPLLHLGLGAFVFFDE
jgi:hypothetical protein